MEPYDLKSDIRRTVAYWYMIDLTDEQIDVFLEWWKKTFEEDMEAFDTMEREDFAGYVANIVVGRDWPIYGDGHEVGEQFMNDFYSKVEDFGFKLIRGEK